MPEGTSSTDYGLEFEFSDWGYGSVITSRRASDGSNAGNIRFDSDFGPTNNKDLNMGSSAHSRFRHTDTGNNTLQVGVATDDADDCSGAFTLINSSHMGTAYRSPGVTHANPNFYVYATSTDANEYIRFEHDATNANIVTGAGDISLQPASGVVGISGGISAGAGITASQYNLGWTNIPMSSGSIDDGAILVHDGDTDTMQKWIHGAKKTIGFFIDGDGAAIATGVKLDALTQVDQYWTIESVRLYCQEGVVAPDTTTISLYKTTDIEDSEANIESGATQLTLNGALTTSLSISNKSGTEYEKQTGPPTGGTYTLEPDEWIFPKILANTSAQKIKIFIELKATTI
jgi:hypothetical protein